jgi:uncharacterized protein
MDTTLVDAVFVQIEKFRVEGKRPSSIYLFGGEPLLTSNKDVITRICLKAKEADIPIFCISNGYNLDSYVDLIVEYEFKLVQITLDGIASEHDSRRFLSGGQGSYDHIVTNVDLALKKGVNIVLRTNVNKKNISAIAELIKLYEDKKWTKFPNFRYYFKSTLKCFEETGNAYSDIELMGQLSKIYGDNISKFAFNSIYSTLAFKLSEMIKSNKFAPLHASYCGANAGMLTIDPYGDIYPCWDILAEERYKIGFVNVEHGKFEFFPTANDWWDRQVCNISECSKCKYLLFCGGGCAAQANAVSGSLYAAFCDDYKLLFDEVAVDVAEKHFMVRYKDT